MTTKPSSTQPLFPLIEQVASSIQDAEVAQITLLSAGCISVKQCIDNLQRATAEAVRTAAASLDPTARDLLERAISSIRKSEAQHVSRMSARRIKPMDCIALLLMAKVGALAVFLDPENMERLGEHLCDRLDRGTE